MAPWTKSNEEENLQALVRSYYAKEAPQLVVSACDGLSKQIGQCSNGVRLAFIALFTDDDEKRMQFARESLSNHPSERSSLIAHDIFWENKCADEHLSAKSLDIAKRVLQSPNSDFLLTMFARRTVCEVGEPDEVRKAINDARVDMKDLEILNLYMSATQNALPHFSLELAEEALPLAQQFQNPHAYCQLLLRKIGALSELTFQKISRTAATAAIDEETESELSSAYSALHELDGIPDAESSRAIALIIIADMQSMLGNNEEANRCLDRSEVLAKAIQSEKILGEIASLRGDINNDEE